jgi:hypothetical protein
MKQKLQPIFDFNNPWQDYDSERLHEFAAQFTQPIEYMDSCLHDIKDAVQQPDPQMIRTYLASALQNLENATSELDCIWQAWNESEVEQEVVRLHQERTFDSLSKT